MRNLNATAFLSSPALSMQFVLSEWLRAFESVRKLKVSSQPQQIQSLQSQVDNLCFYCDILLKTALTSGEKLIAQLNELQHVVWKVKSETTFWKKIESLSHLYVYGERKLALFFRELTPFFLPFRLNENVLLYLLENRLRINGCVGENQVEELFSFLFPGGTEDFRKTIEEGFLSRGFHSILSTVHSLIDSIEWESPCKLAPK